MKIIAYIIRILAILIIGISVFSVYSTNYTYAEWEYIDTLNWWLDNLNTKNFTDPSADDKWRDNEKLEKFAEETPKFIKSEKSWARQIAIFLARIAKDLKNIFFSIAFIYFLVITLRLLLAGNSEEAIWKFKKWILWITVGLIIMQLAFSLTVSLFDQDVNWETAINFVEMIVYPLVNLLSTLASLFFIAICIYAFYRLITSNWEEEKAKSAKMTIFYWILGFIIIKISDVLVKSFYGKTACEYEVIAQNKSGSCTGDLSWVAALIFTVINWLNGFVAIIVVIMIIYVWAQVMTSNWEEEKLKKAKKAILYIFIWILVLVMNYLILTFWLLQWTNITTP